MADSDSGSLGRDLRVCVSNKLPCIASIGLWAIYFEEQGLRGLLVNLYSCLPKPRNTGIFVFLKPLYSEELFLYRAAICQAKTDILIYVFSLIIKVPAQNIYFTFDQ